ncbi:2OG-Fe dioxygenase family protein [Mycobacterium heidelbergense]|uniref:2OG-Fe dioxygenase family protein n=1 Tax=Mycobacterium heidelbergense TaxID=53376 RepID=UPI003CEDC838
MARITSDRRTHADPVAVAAEQLTGTGAALIPSFDVTRSLGVGREAWTRFGRHWQDLVPDPYAAELGVVRLRRYGQYLFRDGVARRMPANTFAQPDDSNPLYINRGRDFEPLTDAFGQDPLLHKVIKLLARFAEALDDAVNWNVKVHPFRVRSTGDGGHPTPEGMHRDGVTLVSALMIGRRNAIGGESSVCDLDGRRLLTTTLAEPGTLLLGDDRRTLHGVTPVRPIDGPAPAQRDVLVITFASRWP